MSQEWKRHPPRLARDPAASLPFRNQSWKELGNSITPPVNHAAHSSIPAVTGSYLTSIHLQRFNRPWKCSDASELQDRNVPAFVGKTQFLRSLIVSRPLSRDGQGNIRQTTPRCIGEGVCKSQTRMHILLEGLCKSRIILQYYEQDCSLRGVMACR